jgi:glycine cleavage system H protein
LQAPVSGEVVAINGDVTENFDQIAESPYEDGWMIRIRPSDPAEMDVLMDEASYKAFTESDAGH